MALQIRRGTTLERVAGFVPAIAEPIYDTDEKAIYIGDGTAIGGLPLSVPYLNSVGDVSTPTFPQTTIVSYAANGVTLTVTTLDPHGLAAGRSVLVWTNLNPALRGIYVVTAIGGTYQFSVASAQVVPLVTDGGYIQQQGYNLRNGAQLFYSPSIGSWVATDPPLTGNKVLVYNAGTSNWESREFEITGLADVDTVTYPLSDGDTLVWDSTTSKWQCKPGGAGGTSRGDGGNFSITEDNGFVLGVYGGGNFATTQIDRPIELISGVMDAGSF